MSKNQDDRSSGVACRSRTDGQTDRPSEIVDRPVKESVTAGMGVALTPPKVNIHM